MGEKANLNLEKRYRLLVFREESYTCKNTKSILGYTLVVWSIVYSFSFVLLYFFNLFFFSIFLSSPLSLNAFSRYIPWSLHYSHRTRVSQALGASPCPISHLLEPSTISCKTACLLFRHHLHINAARELIEKYLMWR